MADTGPDMSRLGLGLLAMSVILALTVFGMHVAGRFLESNDPRRAVAIRAILWIGTVLLVVILLRLRQ